jgi:hypothetical protein
VDQEVPPQMPSGAELAPDEPGAAPPLPGAQDWQSSQPAQSAQTAQPGPAAPDPVSGVPGPPPPPGGSPISPGGYPISPSGGYSPPPGGYPPPPPSGHPVPPPGEGQPGPGTQPYPTAYPYAEPPPPGYPTGPQGSPYPPGSVATPRSTGNRGWKIGITAAVALVVAAAATAVVLLLVKGESPTTMALQSGQAIAPAAGLTFTGTIAGESANLTVTRAGTVEGSYTQGGNSLTRITINGVTYLKASAAFWKDQVINPLSAPQAAGNWAKAPASAVSMNLDSLTPTQISRTLEHMGNQPRVAYTTLSGTKVIKLTDHRTSYYITVSSPNRLLQVTGRSGTAPYSFSITPLTAITIGPVFTILHSDVQGLQGAVDPVAFVLPLQKIQFHSDCNSNNSSSCTVSEEVSVTDTASPTVLVEMTADFSGTKGGSPFTTCTDTVSSADTDVTPSCGISGSAWTGWINSHSSNFNTWVGAHFEATVNSASDIATLQNDLDQQQKG